MAAASHGDPAPLEKCDDDTVMDKIFDFIGDENLGKLKQKFLTKGQGRRPNLPPIQCSNKTILQFYCLKLQSNRSWDDMSRWMNEVFPEFPRSRFRNLTERTVSVAKQLYQEEFEKFKEYCSEVHDFNFIGPFCEKVGLNKPVVIKLCECDDDDEVAVNISKQQIVNGLVLEIYEFVSHEWNTSLIERIWEKLQPGLKIDYKFCKNLKKKYAKERKSTVKGTKFLNSVCAVVSGVPVSKSAVQSQTDQNRVGFCKAKGELEHMQFENKELHDQVQALTELSKEKDDLISKLKSKVEISENQVTSYEKSVKKLRCTVGELSGKLKKTTEKCNQIRHSARYMRLSRKENDIRKREKKIEALEQMTSVEKMMEHKRKIKLLQTSVSNKKSVIQTLTLENRELRKEVDQLKKENSTIQSELDITNSEKLETRVNRNQFSGNLEKCVMALVGECDVPSTKVSVVIKTICQELFNKIVHLSELPCPNTVVNMLDRAHVLSKFQVAETIANSKRWDLHHDGTSRDHKKILGHQVTLDDGTSLSAGFTGMATEDSQTLLDAAVGMMTELADIYSTEESEAVYKSFLEKMFATMSDRAAVNKCFNTTMNTYRSKKLGEESDLHFLFCNAHFLLGLSNETEKMLKNIEKGFEEPLGRDKESRFARFSSSSESATSRYVRTACDVFGPRGDEKNGCREQWEAFCSELLQEKSYVTSYRQNRFNNFFQGAAGLYYHKETILNFLSNYKVKPNLKLQSVYLDSKCVQLQSLVRALGLVFYKITGPFWQLLQSNTQYVDLHKYIHQMLQCFEKWSLDASPLLDEELPGIFIDFKLPTDTVLQCLCKNDGKLPDVKLALEKLMSGFVAVTERQLDDFLPGGRYSFEEGVPSELRDSMSHCKLTNLMGENEFGDLDFSQFRRRHASMHFHSGVQMVKQNRTISEWLKSKSQQEQEKLLRMAKEKSVKLREKHRSHEKEIVRKTKERLENVQKKKAEKEAQKACSRQQLLQKVRSYGGPVTSRDQLNAVLRDMDSSNAKLDIIKNEIRYIKEFLNVKDKRLIFAKKGIEELTEALFAVRGTYSLSEIQDHEEQVHDIVLESSNHAGTTWQCKRKRHSSGSSTDDSASDIDSEELPAKRTKCLYEFGKYRFDRQGVWIAVAYEQDFFIGQVTEIYSPSCGQVQFLSRGYKDVFKWPRVSDIDDINSKFVISSDVRIETNNNGRTWFAPEMNKICEAYSEFKSVYFMDI